MRNSVLNFVCYFVLIPAIICFGVFVLGDRSYYGVSAAVVVLALVPMLLNIEQQRLRAREISVLAVLTALTVAGRAVFFMLPQCKPSGALVVAAGALLGRRSGFMVGALSALVSNFLFGQGPWTPWQMLGLGLVGYLAGALFCGRKPPRFAVCLYGAAAVFLIYGTLMNLSSLLMMTTAVTWQGFLAVQLSGLWFNLVFALATAAFLWLCFPELAQKLGRMRVKYGLRLT